MIAALKSKRDFRAEYTRRRESGYRRWSSDRKPRCPSCGFTYSDFFPRVETPVLVTAQLLKQFARKGFATGRSEAVRYTVVGECVYLCSGCYEQLILGRITNTAPLPERIGPEYEKEYAYAQRRGRCPSCGGPKGYWGELCIKCASKRREAMKQISRK